MGTNFATNGDINFDNGKIMLATGHRGFNNEGAEVKMWDLTEFKNDSLPKWTYTKHKFTPEAVRFLNSDIMVSASKDQ